MSALQEELRVASREADWNESDEVLMVRVASGDTGAYETLYHRYKNRILTFVLRYVGDRDWAEDLTQEVFLKVYRTPKSFDPRNRFLTWLFAVARNLTIDYLRRKRPTAALVGVQDDDEYTIEPETNRAQGPIETTLLSEMDGKLQGVLMELSPKLREVFILCAMQGLSYEEVAGIVRCPAKTVSSRLSRARERFAAAFEPYLQGKRPR
jgi:RNA polymerase sigma-70 factor, ECF subfamily